VQRIAVVLIALLLSLSVPAVAGAQLGPTNVPAPLTTPDEETDSTPFDEDTGLSTLQLVLIFGAAITVLGLIAYLIVRDAHTAAPVAGRAGAQSVAKSGSGASAKAKSAREREREKQRKRNRAKAQRNQRKKNRPR